jgi:hypothetical protein
MLRVERICTVCGRGITRCRQWASGRNEVEYCSDACRSRGLTELDREAEKAIVDLLERRAVGASICPSEVARALFADDDWRIEMERVRMAARRLQRAGRIQIVRNGRPINPSKTKGPIRLRLRDDGAIQA